MAFANNCSFIGFKLYIESTHPFSIKYKLLNNQHRITFLFLLYQRYHSYRHWVAIKGRENERASGKSSVDSSLKRVNKNKYTKIYRAKKDSEKKRAL